VKGILEKVLRTRARTVSILYDGVPGLVVGGSRRGMAPPSPRDNAMNERLCKWYLRWLRWAVMPMGCTPVRKSSRKVSVKESKSRYSWNCGDLQRKYLEGPGFLVSLKRSATWAVTQAVRVMVLGQDCSGVLVLSSDNHTGGIWIGWWW
jgi:hypothetical protein